MVGINNKAFLSGKWSWMRQLNERVDCRGSVFAAHEFAAGRDRAALPFRAPLAPAKPGGYNGHERCHPVFLCSGRHLTVAASGSRSVQCPTSTIARNRCNNNSDRTITARRASPGCQGIPRALGNVKRDQVPADLRQRRFRHHGRWIPTYLFAFGPLSD
jgi:hypothetical protein